ncbi:YceD family protein [Anderseniella sp. Alg231-50]|uniref:YceD family protein n=1 Tax=Anderseniella sp. Alg231-50 TaxID=1922226 RepID=UPI000D55D778
MSEDLEFSRLFDVSRMAPEGASETISATTEECAAVAARFGVEAVHSISATIHIQPWKRGGFRARGEASASITQTCVVTLDPFESDVRAQLDQVFIARDSRLAADDVEVVVSHDEEDIGYIDDGEIELGEFAVEALCLELDPYPRKDGAELPVSSSGEAGTDEPKVSPFAVLKQLKLKDSD